MARALSVLVRTLPQEACDAYLTTVVEQVRVWVSEGGTGDPVHPLFWYQGEILKRYLVFWVDRVM